ncbi:HGGxSTG domain-containing protein [Parasphingorhabdus sp.]|uniref:HGGxSTG domain-containing protein n=1 Tax=Parasphingorhabdus sp. TaxID=2709688 RepID=UPI003592EB7A
MLKHSTDNPMQPERLAAAPRCLAKTRAGTECQAPAVNGNRRCRMHGGKRSGAPNGNRNAWRHGDRSAETEEQLKAVRQANRDLRLITKFRQGQTLRGSEQDRLTALTKK